MGIPANAEFLENNYQGSHESLHHGGGTFKFLSLPVSKGNLNVISMVTIYWVLTMHWALDQVLHRHCHIVFFKVHNNPIKLVWLLLTLKVQQLFYQLKWVYSGIADNCNIRTCKLWQNHRQVLRTKRTALLYRKVDVGRGPYKQRVHWRKLGIQSVVAFHWLSYDNLSLAGPLPGKEKNLPYPLLPTQLG